MALVQKRVFGDFECNARRLGVGLHAKFVQFAVHGAVEVVGVHVGEGATEVPQKAVAAVCALDHAPCQHRQIWRGIVAATTLKFDDHLVGPVLHSRFPTVHRHVLDGRADQIAEVLAHRIHVAGKILLRILRAELIDLIPAARRYRRPILGAGQRVAHAQNCPTPLRAHPSAARRPCPILPVRSTTSPREISAAAGACGCRDNVVHIH